MSATSKPDPLDGDMGSSEGGLADLSSEFMHIAVQPARRQTKPELRARLSRLSQTQNYIEQELPYDPSFAEVDSLDEAVVADDEDYDHHVEGRTIFDKSFVPAPGITRSSITTMSRRQEGKGEIEIWWLNSPTWRRTVPIMCIVMLCMTICNAGAAIYFFTLEDKSADDFDVCKTQACQDVANWILEGLDRDVDPCEDFYRFTCNQYSDARETAADAPTLINFEVADLLFNERGVLATALRPENDPKNVLIPFFKSCLNQRTRNISDVVSLVSIINSTLPFLFTDPINYRKQDCAALVAFSLGDIGEFRYQLREFPNVTLLPPPDWIRSYNDSLSTQIGFTQFKENLTKTFTPLWSQLEILGPGKPLMNITTAVDGCAQMMRLISGLIFRTGTSLEPQDPAFVRRSRILMATLLGTPNWTNVELDVEGKKFSQNNINDVLKAFENEFHPDDQGPALLGFWVFCILEAFADKISSLEYTVLSLSDVLPHTTGALQEISLERFCFDTVSEHLNGVAYQQFSRGFNTNRLKDRMTEAFLQLQRAMRELFFQARVWNFLQPHDTLILNLFMDPRNRIVLNFPFAHDASSIEHFQELESYFDNFKPGTDFLLNIWNAKVIFNRGVARSWLVDRIQPGRRPQNFKLERLISETDNTFKYENNIYPPIVLFDRPMFFNEMRVFDYAGAILYLTRTYLQLWLKNIDNFRAIRDYWTFESISDLIPELERSKSLRNIFDQPCMLGKKRSSRARFIASTFSKDFLAFLIAEVLYQNPNKYRSLSHRENGSLAEGVTIVYGVDGSFDYVTLVPDQFGFNTLKFLDKSDYITIDPDKNKFQFKRAPNGLEDFTDNQLFYLAAIRHHCYTILSERQKDYGESVNVVLEQIDDFAKTWECPFGSRMNPPQECI